SNGQYRCVSYQSPVNYQADDGSWQPIDTSLLPVAGIDAYATTATPVEVTLADEAPGQKPVTVSDDGWSVTMNLVGYSEDQKLVFDDTAIYTDVAPDTDVAYTVLGDGVKEVITLASAAAPNRFTYRLNHRGLELRQDGQGQWALYAPGSTKPVFRVGAMNACDSSLDAADEPAWAEGAQMTVSPGLNASTISYAVPSAWLSDPARVYPVKIDPNLDISNKVDTYLSAGLPGTSFGTDADLLCGNMNSSAGKCRTLVRFAGLGTNGTGDIPVGSDITGAGFRLRQYWQPATHSDSVYVGRLNSASDWNESSTYNSANSGLTIHSTWPVETVSGTGVWLNISCGAVTEDWFLNGGNKGFIVYEPDASGSGYSRKFRASEYTGADYDPNLNVDYTLDAVAPVTTAPGLQASSTSGWRTGDQSVTLSATDGNGSPGGNSPGAGVAHTYYKLPGGSQTTYTEAFTVAGQGQHSVEYWSVDAASPSNSETHHTGWVNIDTTAPTSTATGLQATNCTGWQITNQSVTLIANDPNNGANPGSGVAATYYKLDGGSQTPYSGALTVSGVGQHTLEYWAADVAGNSGTHAIGYVNICDAAQAAPRMTTYDLGEFADTATGAILNEGSLQADVTDLSIDSWGPAARLERSYSSTRTSPGYFAPGWRFSFERSLAGPGGGSPSSSGACVFYYDEHGEFYLFNKVGSVWQAPNGMFATLATSGSGWTLSFKDKSVLTFDGAGRLISEADLNGNTVTYDRSVPGHLRITAANGRVIDVSLNGSGQATSASYATADGTRTVNYTTAAQWQVTYFVGNSALQHTAQYDYTSSRLTGL
ncbi:MAG: hypothetical protein WCP21_12895, partial [Armatimonadota bacterium]